MKPTYTEIPSEIFDAVKRMDHWALLEYRDSLTGEETVPLSTAATCFDFILENVEEGTEEDRETIRAMRDDLASRTSIRTVFYVAHFFWRVIKDLKDEALMRQSPAMLAVQKMMNPERNPLHPEDGYYVLPPEATRAFAQRVDTHLSLLREKIKKGTFPEREEMAGMVRCAHDYLMDHYERMSKLGSEKECDFHRFRRRYIQQIENLSDPQGPRLTAEDIDALLDTFQHYVEDLARMEGSAHEITVTDGRGRPRSIFSLN